MNILKIKTAANNKVHAEIRDLKFNVNFEFLKFIKYLLKILSETNLKK